MAGMSDSPAGQWLAALCLFAALLYLIASTRLRQRGDRWPVRRQLSFLTGCGMVVEATVATLPGEPFTAHMTRHVLLGMLAPVLLVAGRPGTLLLRILSGAARKVLVRIARSAAATVMFPPVAAAFDLGGLWVLYRTPLFAAIQTRPWLDATVQLHVLTGGLLFSAAICQLDPVRHRYGLGLRAATLVAAGTAHSVLAKTTWVTAPPHTLIAVDDLHGAAQLMYYGGDFTEIALTVIIAGEWYAASGRELRRQRRRRTVPAPDRFPAHPTRTPAAPPQRATTRPEAAPGSP